MTGTMWVVLAVGVLIGMYLGRWWAEIRRARFDMDRIWASRRTYRDG